MWGSSNDHWQLDAVPVSHKVKARFQKKIDKEEREVRGRGREMEWRGERGRETDTEREREPTPPDFLEPSEPFS